VIQHFLPLKNDILQLNAALIEKTIVPDRFITSLTQDYGENIAGREIVEIRSSSSFDGNYFPKNFGGSA
jgi:hypothetical protein